MKHFCANGKPIAFWKGLSKPRYNNSFSLKPGEAFTFCLDTKSKQNRPKGAHGHQERTLVHKSQGCIPLCYPSFQILNKIELSRFIGIRHNFVFNGFCAEGQRSWNARPIDVNRVGFGPKAIKEGCADNDSLSSRNARPIDQGAFGLSSTDRLLSFGPDLGFLRDMFDNCSAVVRQSFDCASTNSRRAVEEHSKPTRSGLEEVSNKSRSVLEQFSKNSRTATDKDIAYECGRAKAVVQSSYCCPTSVLLQSYYSPTKELLNAYGVVPPWYLRSRSVVLLWADCSGSIVQHLKRIAYGLQLKIKSLQPIAYRLLLCFSLKYLLAKAMKNTSIPFGIGLMYFMLFSLSDARAQSAEPRAAEGQQMDTTGHRIVPFSKEAVIKRIRANPKYNLATYPLQNYEIDRKIISGISLGQSIPEEVWDMRLRIVRADGSEDTCTLSAFNNDKFLILDFWTTWCQPCVASVNKWENILSKKKDKVQLVNVHLGFDYQAPPFIADRGWHSPTVIDMGARLLNAYFFTTEAFGKIVWIKSGKLYAITTASQLSEEELEAIVMGNGKVQSTTEGVYSN